MTQGGVRTIDGPKKVLAEEDAARHPAAADELPRAMYPLASD